MKLRFFLIFVLVFIAYVASAFANPFPPRKSSGQATNSRDVKYGVSWSFEQAGWYGLDPRGSYVRLLDETKFDWVRLAYFWDQGNIDDLRFGIGEAKKRNIKVIIVMGAKTPYYPEYHFPDKISKQVKFGNTISADHPIARDLLASDKKLVTELSDYVNIIFWQVENEPFLANVNNWRIDKSLISAEVDAVRGADPMHRPIILNHVGPSAFDKRYRDLLDILKPGDVLGVNAYFKTQGINLFAFSIFGYEIRIPWPKWFVWPVQSWVFLSPDFNKLRDEVESKGLSLWVLEMQAEPYIRVRPDADPGSWFYKPEDIRLADDFLKAYGISSVGLWGAPFWVYRESIGDRAWIDAVRRLTVNSRQ